MSGSSLSAKRASIGALALVCLGAAVSVWFFAEHPETSGWLSALTRVGVVLAALWLAMPARGESIAWTKAAPILVAAIVLVALTRRMFPYILPIAAAVALAAVFLRPRSKRGRRR